MMRIWLRPLASAAHLPRIGFSPGESKTLGRSVQAEVVLDEPSLSRLHARLSVDRDGVVTVEDLGSKNGVFINGVPRQSGSLMSGDVVRFGLLDYLVDKEDPVAVPASIDHTILRVAVTDDTAASVDRAVLEGLLATSRELMAFTDLSGLLDRVLDRLQNILNPDRSAILFLDPGTSELRLRAMRPVRAYSSVSDFASATVVREALNAREVLVIQDACLDSRLQQAESVALAGIRSVICVPLFGRAGPIGALYADRLALTGGFTPEQAQYAAGFASHAATALETARLNEDREQHFRATLEVFAKAIDARDGYTAGHSERVTAYTLVLARTIGVGAAELEVVRRACMLHDIGKVGVPDAVLLKPGPLDSSERAVMESHVSIGHEMLRTLPFLQEALPSIRGHHERWDGRGYPDRLAAADIHVHGRLIAVADSYDAMTTARPYRNALPVEEAVRRVRADKGRQFDPAAVDAFDAVENEFLVTRKARYP
jgi:putative nucleotidyltransferase with HDIG domain